MNNLFDHFNKAYYDCRFRIVLLLFSQFSRNLAKPWNWNFPRFYQARFLSQKDFSWHPLDLFELGARVQSWAWPETCWDGVCPIVAASHPSMGKRSLWCPCLCFRRNETSWILWFLLLSSVAKIACMTWSSVFFDPPLIPQRQRSDPFHPMARIAITALDMAVDLRLSWVPFGEVGRWPRLVVVLKGFDSGF